MPLLAILLSAPAWSQGFDARGPVTPPETADPADAPWTIGRTATGAAALRLSYVDRPLVRTFPDGTRSLVVEDLAGAELTVLSPALGPARLGLVAPALVGGGGESPGFAAGDILLYLPVGVTPGDAWLAVTPTLRLPVGSEAHFVGDPGVAPGLAGSAHVRAGPFALGADAGIEVGPATGLEEWPGGPMGHAVASVGVVPIEALGLHAAVRSRAPVGRSLAGVPSEVGLQARWRWQSAFGSVSAGRALTRGVGAPAGRLEAALGWSPRVAEPELLPVVATPPPPPLERLRVTDATGSAVRAASVTVGYSPSPASPSAKAFTTTTDAAGVALLPSGVTGTARVGHEGFADVEVTLAAVGPEQAVTLARPPVPLSLRVVDAEGRIVTAPIAIEPAVDLLPDEVGTWRGALLPGTYVVTTAVEGQGTQRRTIVVDERRTDPLLVDVVLQPSVGPGALSVQVTDPLGRPVEDVELRLDGRPLGSTATGGDVRVEGLAPATASLVALSEDFRAPPAFEVLPAGQGPAAGDAPAALIVLDWPDGGVLVRALGPDGVVTDALVAFHGPAALPPAPLGPDGERLFTVRPGEWSVLVSSPTLGAQERHFVVAPDEELVRLDVTLTPAEVGDADLIVAVIGPEGPVAGAAVSLAGAPLGLTGPDGTLTALGLHRGPRALAVEAQLLRSYAGTIDLFGGGQAIEVPVHFAPGAIELVARDPDGRPVDAVLAGRAGELTLPAARLGDDGTERVALAPGRWDLAVSEPRFGTQVRTLTIGPDDDGLRRIAVHMLLPDDDGGRLRVQVRDPDGAPVEGARVWLGGQPLGTTGDGGLDAQSLPRTTSEIGVEADALLPGSTRVRVTEDTSIVINLGWAPGAARVTVEGPGGPADALVAASGPLAVAPRRAGADGRVLLGLAPGPWRVLASTPALGAAEVDAVLPAEARLTPIAVALSPPPPEGTAVLLVRVRDADRRPISGAAVRIGDHEVATSAGGNALFDALAPGAVDVTIAGGFGLEERRISFDLPTGSHERIVLLARALRTVEVRAVDPTGRPVAARIVAEGSATVAGEAAPDRPATLQLPPGRWSVSARADEGVGTSTIEIAVGTEPVALELSVAPTESRLEGAAVVLGSAVPFDLDQATLRPDAVPILDDVARLLRAETGIVRVEIGGHTDDRGGVAYNQDLSERRAAAVRDALVERGIDPERLVSRGYGLMRPLAAAADDASRARNRRVELVVLERTD